jgi:hypothetical protein
MTASNVWTPPEDFAAGEVVTATKGNKHWRDNEQYLHEKDSFGYNSFATDSGTFTTVETDIILLTAAVPTGHDRVIWHEAMLHFESTVADSVILIRVYDVTAGSTLLNKFFTGVDVAAQPHSFYLAHRQAAPGAGSYNYKITAVRNTGTGTLKRSGASDQVGWYKVRGG